MQVSKLRFMKVKGFAYIIEKQGWCWGISPEVKNKKPELKDVTKPLSIYNVEL